MDYYFIGRIMCARLFPPIKKTHVNWSCVIKNQLIILLYRVRKLYTARILYTYKYIIFFFSTDERAKFRQRYRASRMTVAIYTEQRRTRISIFTRRYSMYYKRRLYIILLSFSVPTLLRLYRFLHFSELICLVSPILYIFVCGVILLII